MVLFMLIGASALLGVGCGSGSPPYERVTEASLIEGASLPDPNGAVILTVSGAITAPSGDSSLAFDMKTLEQLGLARYSVYDPWFEVEASYTGVLMSDLIAFAGVSDSATTVHMEALDDYQVDIPIDEIRRWPILLVTRTNGEYMTVANAGPTRIIFPNDSYPIDPSTHNDLWIWSVRSIEVR